MRRLQWLIAPSCVRYYTNYSDRKFMLEIFTVSLKFLALWVTSKINITALILYLHDNYFLLPVALCVLSCRYHTSVMSYMYMYMHGTCTCSNIIMVEGKHRFSRV